MWTPEFRRATVCRLSDLSKTTRTPRPSLQSTRKSTSPLLPLMTVSETLDVSPFDGLSMGLEGGDVDLGPVCTALGRVSVRRHNGVTALVRHGETLIEVKGSGRLTNLEIGHHQVSATLPASRSGDDWLKLPSTGRSHVLAAFVNGDSVAPVASGIGTDIRLGASASPRQVQILLSPPPA